MPRPAPAPPVPRPPAALDPAAGPSLGHAALDTEWAAQTYRTGPPPAEIPWAQAGAGYAAQEKRLADPALCEHTPPRRARSRTGRSAT